MTPSSVSTSLTLQALLKATIAKAGLGASGRPVAGLTAAAQALYLAAAANRHAPQARPGVAGTIVLVVAPTDADVEQLTCDIRFFLAALEGLSEAAVTDAVLPFPSHEVDPYRGIAPHMGVVSARTRALHAAATGTARVIVASATGLLPRLSAPDRLRASSLELRPGQDIDPYQLAAVLVDAGFTREDPVDSHGEFCLRGGVLDVFPAGAAQPARLDFVGDTIESIRRFDPATQRSTGEIERVTVVPLREVFLPVGSKEERAAARERLRAANLAALRAPLGAPAGEGDELEEDGIGLDPVAPRRASSSSDDDLSWAWQGDDDVDAGEENGNGRPAALPEPGEAAPPRADGPGRQGLLTPGADRSSSLLDYVQRPLIFVCEADEVRARAEKSLDQIALSHRDATARGAKVPPPADLFMPAGDLDTILELGTHLAELAIGGDDASARLEPGATTEGDPNASGVAPGAASGAAPGFSPAEADEPPVGRPFRAASAEGGGTLISTQPTVEFRGRIGDWVQEIKAARARAETVLFVAATPGRGERTLELLRDYELIAVPVFVNPKQRDNLQARGEMAHAASVLVATGGLSRGFRLPAAALQVYAETDVFEEERRAAERRRSAARTFLSDFRDLKVGDFVVHVDHGIGVFVGLRQIGVGRSATRLAGVPRAALRRRGQAVRPGRAARPRSRSTPARSKPPLDRLGGTTWESAKTRVKKAMRDMAEELLKLYAARKARGRPRLRPRHALAGGVRGRLRVRADARPAGGHRRHQARHGVGPRRWTGCSAATSATARPRSPCAPPSRR